MSESAQREYVDPPAVAGTRGPAEPSLAPMDAPALRGHGAFPAAMLVSLQQSAGNTAVATVLARQPKASADPGVERAKRLAKLLREHPPERALTELKSLDGRELADLDERAAASLSRDDAILVRRGIAFVRHWENRADEPHAKGAEIDPKHEGTPSPQANATVEGGKVEVRTGATASIGEGYTLSYTVDKPKPGAAPDPKAAAKANDVRDAHWLQFIWREIVTERPTKGRPSPAKTPLESRIPRGGGSAQLYYWLTTDEKHPNWNTDTPTASSPFFEESTGSVTKRTDDTLEMFDKPDPEVPLALRAFGPNPDADVSVVSHAHTTVYLVRGMNVMYRAEIDLSWTFTHANIKKPNDVHAESKAKGGPASEIAPEHRSRLLKQFADLDYLPGKPVPAPGMQPRFGFVHGPLSEAEWTAKTDLKERFADVARIAEANKIDDVWELSASAINAVPEVRVGGQGVKPGLNLATAKLVPDGEGLTGFVDHDVFQGKELPVSPSGPLPHVAIILGPKAFARGEAFALATLRHEMEHARHFGTAIDWLVKWRDERPQKPFPAWLDAQQIPKDVLALIHVTGKDAPRGDSELLAYIEGFVASFQFLPPVPDIALMRTGDYPAAIAALHDLGDPNNAGWSKDVRAKALDRIHELCCHGLGEPQRNALIAWVDALLEPTLFKPTASDEKVVQTIRNDFGTGEKPTVSKRALKQLLEDLRQTAKKPCSA